MLTTKQQKVLEYHRRGLKDHEIASLLGICRESVNRLLRRARAALRKFRLICQAHPACAFEDALLG